MHFYLGNNVLDISDEYQHKHTTKNSPFSLNHCLIGSLHYAGGCYATKPPSYGRAVFVESNDTCCIPVLSRINEILIFVKMQINAQTYSPGKGLTTFKISRVACK